jgi:hypothetical protein
VACSGRTPSWRPCGRGRTSGASSRRKTVRNQGARTDLTGSPKSRSRGRRPAR